MIDLNVIVPAMNVQAAIAHRGRILSKEYSRSDDLLVIGVLNGAYLFTADLTRYMPQHVQVEFVRAQSYEGQESTGTLNIWPGFDTAIVAGRKVLLLEDIIDTGLTARKLYDWLADDLKAESVRLLAMLDKPARRLIEPPPYEALFTLDGEPFVVGYGLDLDNRMRNLTGICAVNEEPRVVTP